MIKAIKDLLFGLFCLVIPTVFTLVSGSSAMVSETDRTAETQSIAAEETGDREYGETDGGRYENLGGYNGDPCVAVNEGVPFFTSEEMAKGVFEEYSDFDELGRCGAAFACIGPEIMPFEERGKIGDIRPTGWHTVKYDVIADRYLYNRCHLIGYQLAGENANEKNLITGTRFLNTEGMLPWENLVADYVKRTGNHVLYRVTPYFEKDNLVASGVLMEAYSIEDHGEGVCFNVFCYNIQPGIVIDYATGDSYLDEKWAETAESVFMEAENERTRTEQASEPPEFTEPQSEQECDYVLNINTMKFHIPSCDSVLSMKEKNKSLFSGERETLIENGFSPCKRCNP